MDIFDNSLAPRGQQDIEWAERAMPAVMAIRERFARERPLEGIRAAACMHVTAETAVLVRTLAAGGAEVRLCASNPLSVQNTVAAGLAVLDGIEVFAIAGEDRDTYFRHLGQAVEHRPHLVLDDGADLTTLLHTKRTDLLDSVIGGTEETTTGVTRLHSMAREGVLRFPVFAVNDARTKHMFDNRYGTGQSTLDAFMRATNRLIAGSTFVVCGYGWCGRGVAERAAGLGARVIVTEVDPVRGLEALMDGLAVMPLKEAVEQADFLCTTTGNEHVVRAEHFERMKSGIVIANSGHFDVELDLKALEYIATAQRELRDHLTEFTLPGGRVVLVVAQGRLANLAAAEGHPADVMDLSFANQALAAESLALGRGVPAPGVHTIPDDIDRAVAAVKLEAIGVRIDVLTDAQQRYLEGWRTGT
ncbi:MAG: adenosylhomocysteinase [Nannocystales bacterium]